MSAQLACQAAALALATLADAAAAYRSTPSPDGDQTSTYQNAYEDATGKVNALVSASEVGSAPSVTFGVIGTNQYSSTAQTWNATQLARWVQTNLAAYACISPADMKAAADALSAVALQYDY